MELEISIRYFSNSFHRIPSKLYEDIAFHEGMQAITLPKLYENTGYHG